MRLFFVLLERVRFMKEKLVEVRELLKYLRMIGIYPTMLEHDEVISCDDSKKIYDLKGYDEKYYGLAKNMLLRDKKGKKFWLVILDYKKPLDFELLRETIGLGKKIGMATEEDLERLLKTKRGSVSLLNLIYDVEHQVRVIIDEDLISKDYLAFHPNDNTKTVFIRNSDVFEFLDSLGVKYQITGDLIREEDYAMILKKAVSI
jgi:Ala-tRNA(Pro) deacylase